MSGGFMGKFLEVDLSTNIIKIEKPDEIFYRNFLGGIGIGVRYIYSNVPAKTDPLGPEAVLGFVTGLLTGSGLAYSGRYSVVGKSPLTETWGDANSGGYFGLGLKKAGFDAVFIRGKSDKPVYLLIENGKAEIRDASHLWGKTTHETDDTLEKEFKNKKITVASIGPSGEKLSLIAAIINDHGRAAARSGLGAVMGSKKLKAVVVTGNQEISIAHPEDLKELKKQYVKRLKRKPNLFYKIVLKVFGPFLPSMYKRGIITSIDYGTLKEMWGAHGTSVFTAISCQLGDSPTKNWAGVGSRDFPMKTKSSKLTGENMDKYVKKKFGCAHCVLPCSAVLEVGSKEVHRPEYETLSSFGSLLLNDDLDSIIEANHICNSFGLDTISAGSVIAFAMECYENGILTKEDIDGIDLTWGNSEAILQILNKIARREGFGDVLANGVRKASEVIGKGSEKYAIHVHGQELPMHDSRLSPSFGTTYVTDPTPGRHTAGGIGLQDMGLSYPFLENVKETKTKRWKYEGKGEMQALYSRLAQSMLNALGLCYFCNYLGPYPLFDAMKAVTGWDFTFEELVEIGERIQNLRQAFNVRDGLKPSDFKLPDRAKGIPPLDAGASKGKTIDLDTMVKEFYDAMDWNLKDGKPSKQKLHDLKLDDVVEDLYSN
ncbi:MAG: aldehyde ferredoxin oxidoreductase family protein [Candidatus Helarchaeota archaeon]